MLFWGESISRELLALVLDSEWRLSLPIQWRLWCFFGGEFKICIVNDNEPVEGSSIGSMMYLCLTALIFLVANAAGEALSGCSSDTQCPLHGVPKASCVEVTGAASEFAVNGYYCAHEGVDGSYHAIATLQDNKLQYEIRSDDNFQWQLIRITKTKRDWVELPVYRGLPTQDANPQTLPQDLNGVAWSLGSDLIDKTEPAIDVSIANVPSAVIESLHVLKKFQSGQIDACQLAACSAKLSPLLVGQSNEQIRFLGR